LKGWESVPCFVFRVPRCGIRRLLQVVDFSDGFVISKKRIVNEAVNWYITFRVLCSAFRVVGLGDFCKELILGEQTDFVADMSALKGNQKPYFS